MSWQKRLGRWIGKGLGWLLKHPEAVQAVKDALPKKQKPS